MPGMSAVARIDSGGLEGRLAGGVVRFLGVPYAAPPVGALRWRPPQPVTPWGGVRSALAFGFDAPQTEDPGDQLAGVQPQSEDCLTLNVWAPAARSAPLPVMVWLHGGGFTNGAASSPAYDGAVLARLGIVVVTLNYRLGRLGFFAHPALSAATGDEPAGVYGFMDQVFALQWVRRNIAAFGGDPGRVTIAGESAGGWAVNMLMTAPGARGLFHGAIAQSAGGRAGTFGRSLATWDQALAAGEAFAAQAGIKGDGPDALAALRALPVEALLTEPFFTAPRDTYAGPMVDGRLVTADPGDLFAAGEAAPVPYLVGANSREVDDMPEARPMAAALLAASPIAPALAQAYGDADQAEAGLMSDVVFVEPARFTACSATAGAYLYRFGYPPQAWRDALPGAPHTMDVPFVFGVADGGDDDRAVAAMMSRYWANFVRAGNPNGPGQPDWPPHDGDRLLIVDAQGRAAAGADPKRAVLDLLAAAPFDPA